VLFLSGVFFPLSGLPAPLRWLALANPLTHAVHLVRPLTAGSVPDGWALELLWVLLAAALGAAFGTVSLRRRMVV